MTFMNPLASISYYQGQIDMTQFGIVANYLTSPRSPIAHVLHVRDPSMLARLAAQLEAAMSAGPAAEARVREVIVPLLQDGSLKVSSRERQESPVEGAVVDPAGIPPRARCQVIYLPPFYLVHTAGLFEGTLHANKSRSLAAVLEESEGGSPVQKPSRKRMKNFSMKH